jgi:nucleoside-diphosphate-sugar epimerase
MNLNSSTVFLAGATGLAGSAIISHLLELYPDVRIRAVYHKTSPHIEHKQVEYVQGDLRSLDGCRQLAAGSDCAVMAAANTGGAAILESQPWGQINDNAIMNAQMLEAFTFENVKRVAYVSSASLYQECEKEIREEELDLNKDPCMSHYGMGWVVRFIEKLCWFWHGLSRSYVGSGTNVAAWRF